MRNPLKYLAIILTLALLSGAVAGTGARADMRQHLGFLSGIVKPGDDGTWVTEDGDGWFIMTNEKKAGAIRHYWFELPERFGNEYDVSVNLVAQNATANSAFGGLVFDYEAADSYIAVTIGSDGIGHVFYRSPDGFKRERIEGVRVRNDGSDMLRARVKHNEVRFEVNGVKMIDIIEAEGFSHRLGIIAIGQGQFGFTGFSVE